jgi:outer membrane murein-binding lipoprotein Lpp
MDDQIQAPKPSQSKLIIVAIVAFAVLLVGGLIFMYVLQTQINNLSQVIIEINETIEQWDKDKAQAETEKKAVEDKKTEELPTKQDLDGELEPEPEPEPVQIEPIIIYESFMPVFLGEYQAFFKDKSIGFYEPPKNMVKLASWAVNSCQPGEEGMCTIGGALYGPNNWDKPGEQEYYIGLLGGEGVYLGPYKGELQQFVKEARHYKEIYTEEVIP